MVMRFNTGLLEDEQIEGQFSQDVDTTTGLTFGLRGGFFTFNDRIDVLADSTVTLTDDDTNFVYIDWSVTPAITAVRITDWPDEEYVPCYKVVTASGVITSVEEWRIRAITFQEAAP